MEFLAAYWLFFLKLLTSLGVVGIFVLILISIRRASGRAQEQVKPDWNLSVHSLRGDYDEYCMAVDAQTHRGEALKAVKKTHKTTKKRKKKQKFKGRLFVLDFDGDVSASDSFALQEEVTAIIRSHKKGDKVLVRLESPGGSVNGYGLAASQLTRLRDADIFTTISVDKVAASGGYMMACVGNEIVAAPFSYIGSIGVVSMMPNFSKVLKKNDVDVDYYTAGKYKRTVTMFGENTEEAKEKHRAELAAIHRQFKGFVAQYRKDLDIEAVATGEFWLAFEALEKGLIDKIQIGEDYILEAMESGYDPYLLKYCYKKGLKENMLGLAQKLRASMSSKAI